MKICCSSMHRPRGDLRPRFSKPGFASQTLHPRCLGQSGTTCMGELCGGARGSGNEGSWQLEMDVWAAPQRFASLHGSSRGIKRHGIQGEGRRSRRCWPSWPSPARDSTRSATGFWSRHAYDLGYLAAVTVLELVVLSACFSAAVVVVVSQDRRVR